jgi:hypothetical protein
MKKTNPKNMRNCNLNASKRRAKTNHYGLSKELIALLDNSVGSAKRQDADTQKFLEEIKKVQNCFKGRITLEEIDKAKREGRA